MLEATRILNIALIVHCEWAHILHQLKHARLLPHDREDGVRQVTQGIQVLARLGAWIPTLVDVDLQVLFR